MAPDQTTSGGRLLLLLISRDVQSAAQLASASELSPAETLRQLNRLADQGFIVGEPDGDGPAVYRLRPAAAERDDPHDPRRILLLDDDAELRELVVTLLEEDGYAVIAAAVPGDGSTLLRHVSFDLAVTDGFRADASAVLTDHTEVLRAAGTTPVVLFTAHRVDLDAALAAGFRALIEKPFDLETLEQQVRSLLDGASPRAKDEP